MKKLTGIPGSPGSAEGKAFLFLEGEFPEITKYRVRQEQAEAEINRLIEAGKEAAEEVRSLLAKATNDRNHVHGDILAAHLMMLEDEDFQEQLTARFRETLFNMEWVVSDMATGMMEKMMASPDARFRERAVDIHDVSRRLLYKLLRIKRGSLAELEEDVIIVARDLLPSEVIAARHSGRVKGIAMDAGGATSHTAILARSFGIPAVLGLSSATKEIAGGERVIVDGDGGILYVEPCGETLASYGEKARDEGRRRAERKAGKDRPAETSDGERVTLLANIGLPEEAEAAREYGAEGIGLYRSEFLFITPGLDAEEERQFEAYRKAAQVMEGRPVTIRTVDIGGDKVLPGFKVTADEKNPLLGWRAIRFSLSLPDLFRTQLRAILRSSVYGPVRILFPLVSGIEELDESLSLLEEAKDDLRKKGQAFAEDIPAGVMIEVPSAAMTADILAERASFFSLGTNDLIQYTLAVDRGNERVNYLAQPGHPAILRLIKGTIDAGARRGIPVVMCGEMAGDPVCSEALLGLGLKVFSMAPPSIPRVKEVIRKASLSACQALAGELLSGKGWRENAARMAAGAGAGR